MKNYLSFMTSFIDFKLVDSLFTINCMKIASIIMVSLSETIGDKIYEVMKSSWISTICKLVKQKSIDVMVQNTKELFLKETVRMV